MPNRAVLFIDGNNWYHSLVALQVPDLGRLNYAKISEKLVAPRTWVGTRYYIGQVRNVGNPRLYADQRRFLAGLQATDSRISVHLGRLEPRTVANEAAAELRTYLNSLTRRIDLRVFHDLVDIAKRHASAQVMVEKAVDVMLAVDLVVMAERDEFDAAYILSADGDYTHAAKAVADLGKTVYAFSPGHGAQLASVVKAYIRPKVDWFDDCY
jgi:hypothetical protein